MSKSLVIATVAGALVLGLIVILVNTGGSGSGGANGAEGGQAASRDGAGEAAPRDDIAASNESAGGESVAFAIDPQRVRAITVNEPGEPSRTVTRLPRGDWVYAEADGPTSNGWPVDGTQGLAALGALESVRISGEADDGPGDDAARATLHMRGGETVELAFARQGVGGNVLIEGPRGPAMAPREAIRRLIDPGLDAWRSRAAAPGVGPGTTSRLTLETANARLSLSRLGGQWFMQSPVSSRTDADAVEALLSLFRGLRVDRFVDGDAPVGAFAGETLAVRAERDVRLAPGERSTPSPVVVRRILIGGPAPYGLGVRFARVTLGADDETDGSNEFIIAVALDDLPSFDQVAAPGTYLAKTAASVRADDVHFMTIRAINDDAAADDADTASADERGFRRSLGDWMTMNPDGTGEPVTPTTADGIGATLNLLANLAGDPAPADDVTGFRGLALVELRDVYGDVADRLTLGYADDGDLAARSGPVVWRYPDVATPPAVLRLPRFDDVTAPAERAAPTTDPATSETSGK